MTKDEALAKMATKWWENSTPREIVEFQLFEDRLCCPFSVFREAVEKTLGRSVWSHEFAQLDLLRVEFRGDAPSPTAQQIVDQIPAEKLMVIEVQGKEPIQ